MIIAAHQGVSKHIFTCLVFDNKIEMQREGDVRSELGMFPK